MCCRMILLEASGRCGGGVARSCTLVLFQGGARAFRRRRTGLWEVVDEPVGGEVVGRSYGLTKVGLAVRHVCEELLH